MMHRLVEIERQALEYKNSGQISEAAGLFAVLVGEQPSWEGGIGFLNLAQCYEDMGRFELADMSYREALKYGPVNDLFLGAYASFLYLHGDAKESLNTYLRLLGALRLHDRNSDVASCLPAIHALGKRLGYSEDMIAGLITCNGV